VTVRWTGACAGPPYRKGYLNDGQMTVGPCTEAVDANPTGRSQGLWVWVDESEGLHIASYTYPAPPPIITYASGPFPITIAPYPD
jgi:hypothetical protein